MTKEQLENQYYVKIFKPQVRWELKGRERVGFVVDREKEFVREDCIMPRTFRKWYGLTEEETDAMILAKGLYMRLMTLEERDEYIARTLNKANNKQLKVGDLYESNKPKRGRPSNN